MLRFSYLIKLLVFVIGLVVVLETLSYLATRLVINKAVTQNARNELLAGGGEAGGQKDAPQRGQRRTQHEGREVDLADVDARASRRFLVAADGKHRTAPLGAGQAVVQDHGEKDEKGEPTRLLKSLQAWGAFSKSDAKAKAKAISARNEAKKK